MRMRRAYDKLVDAFEDRPVLMQFYTYETGRFASAYKFSVFCVIDCDEFRF